MKLRAILAALALATVALVSATPAHAGGTPTMTRHIRFEVTFTSMGTTLHNVDGGKTYGWNHLVGKTRLGNRSAHVDFLGEVNYLNGSGPFGGYITVTRTNGTTLAFTVDGKAMSPATPGTANTRFSGDATVIGGTGPYSTATGTGTMIGVRKAALGSPVTLTFDLRVTA